MTADYTAEGAWVSPSRRCGHALAPTAGELLLVIRRPQLLAHLPAPWPEARPHREVMIRTCCGSRPVPLADRVVM